MKFDTRTISLACLAVFVFFAISTRAQQDENLASRLSLKVHPPKIFIGDPSAASKSQRKPKSDAASPDATDVCTYTFTTGAGLTYLKYCVTVNGNIAEFESPISAEQLDPQGIGAFEGYGICDSTTLTRYYDYANNGDSGNWGSPTTITSNATEVKIERTTGDGAWTLTQTITKVAGTSPYAKIVMALKNNSAVTKEAVLLRFAEPVGDHAGTTGYDFEDYDASLDSAWGNTPYSSSNESNDYGLTLQNVGEPAPLSTLLLQEGLSQTVADGPDPCNAAANYAAPIIEADGSVMYLYLVSS